MAAVPTIGRAAGVERKPAAPEADATRALYERYSRQILNYCVHQLNSREEAEDAVQTTFMNAFRGLKRGIVPEAEQAWLFKIAENVCLSRRRSSWRRGKVESPNDFEVLQEIIPSKHANRADELIGLEDALEAMPENQRRAILLREWQGLSYREIADELGLSQAAVETLIFRARRSLAAGPESPVTPKKRRRIGAAADGLSLGSLIASIKSVLTGGAAIKAVAVAVAAGSATVAATQTEPALVHHLHHQAAKPAQAVRITKQSQATFSSQATIVARASGISVAQAHAKTDGGLSLHEVLAPTRHGPAHFAQAPSEEVTHAQMPPTVPLAPTPATPAPEAPVAAAPTAAAPVAAPRITPTEQPKTEQPKTEQPKTEPTKGNNNDDRGNGNNGKSPGGTGTEAPKADAPKADTPVKTDTKAGNERGNGDRNNDRGNGNDNDRGNGNNGKSSDKKVEAPHAVTVAVTTPPTTPAPPVAPAPATPVVPAPPAVGVQGDSSNGKDKDHGKVGDNRKQEAPPAPAATTPATPPATPPTTPPAAPTAPVTVPPTQPTSPPTRGNDHGNDRGNSKDNGGDKGRGKGK